MCFCSLYVDAEIYLLISVSFCSASNTGMHRRQITDLLDQSIQVHSQCFVITSDNRYILVCGFWDKSFRVYSTDSGNVFLKYGNSLNDFLFIIILLFQIKKEWGGREGVGEESRVWRVFIHLLINICQIFSFYLYCVLYTITFFVFVFFEWWQTWDKELLFSHSITLQIHMTVWEAFLLLRCSFTSKCL